MAFRNSAQALRGIYPIGSRVQYNILNANVQEIKPGMIELMKPKLTFTQSEIQDGDIICFQVDINDKE